jgi:hypothetical protein
MVDIYQIYVLKYKKNLSISLESVETDNFELEFNEKFEDSVEFIENSLREQEKFDSDEN